MARLGKGGGLFLTFTSDGMEYASVITEKKTIEQVEDDYDTWYNPMMMWRPIENRLKKLGPKGPVKSISTSGNR